MALWGISDLIFMQFFCVPTYCSMNMHYISDQKRLLIKMITELIRKNHPRQQEIIIMTNILLRARYALCLVFVLFCFSAIGNVGSLFPDQRLNWIHGPCSGSTESWPLNHKGTPRHWLYQCYHLVLTTTLWLRHWYFSHSTDKEGEVQEVPAQTSRQWQTQHKLGTSY